MGGRGSSGSKGAGGSAFKPGGAKSPLGKPEPTEYFNERSKSSGFRWKRTNLEASYVNKKEGSIHLDSPKDVSYENVNRNTTEARGKISHGFINTANGSMNGKWVGINWNNVKEVTGNTFAIKNDLKEKGFKWNSNTQSWMKN